MDEIRLRPLEPEDLDVLYSIENDIELWSVGCTTAPYSRYLLHDYIAHSTCDIYADRQVRLMAERADGGDVVGIMDITNYEPRHNRAELGMVVKREYRHMGYGRQMAEKIIEYARDVVHIHQLYAVVDADNNASLELFGGCGFTVSHYLEDWLYDGNEYRKAVFLTLFL